MASYANISIVIPQCSSSSLRSHPTTLYRDASGLKGKAKVRWRGWKVVKGEEEGQLGPKLGKARWMVPILVPRLSWASPARETHWLALPLGTVVESIVGLNTELEVAIDIQRQVWLKTCSVCTSLTVVIYRLLNFLFSRLWMRYFLKQSRVLLFVQRLSPRKCQSLKFYLLKSRIIFHSALFSMSRPILEILKYCTIYLASSIA